MRTPAAPFVFVGALAGAAWTLASCGARDEQRATDEPRTEARERAGEGRDAAREPERVFAAEVAPFDEQLRAARSFESATVPPPDVDPVVFAALVPEGSTATPAAIALGRRLFFDPRLSADGTIACATCHDATRGFSDHRAGAEGIGGQVGRRNSPTVLNAALLGLQFWDGRSVTLEDQARLPIVNPIEMGMATEEAAVAAIASDALYQQQFQDAFGRAPNMDDLARAIASYERTLVTLDSPFDRFLRGDEDALSPAARAGWVLFNEKGRCVSCHMVNPSNPVFTDNLFHNIGVAARHQDFTDLARRALAALEQDASQEMIDNLALSTDMSELGRFMVTRSSADMGAFRTQQIRNIGMTAPYMHDGSLQTLWDVMDHYNKGGEPNAFLDGGIEPLALDEEEIDQLVEFMFALTSDRYADVNARELERQRAASRIRRPIRDDEMAQRRRLAFEPAALHGADPTPDAPPSAPAEPEER